MRVPNGPASPCMHACTHGRRPLTMSVCGAQVSARDHEGRSCADVAVAHGHSELAAKLREAQNAGVAGAGGDAAGTPRDAIRRPFVSLRPPQASSTTGSSHVVPEARSQAQLVREAVEEGDEAALSKALDAASASTALREVDSGGLTLLHIAARHGSAGCIGLLVSAGADVDARSKKGNSSLSVAAKHGQWLAAHALLDGGAQADGLALLQAVRRGAERSLQQRLVEAGGAVTTAPDGRSALMMAAAAGEVRSAERVLELGGDVHTADVNGLRALHYCADGGDVPCAQLLIAHGAQLEATDANGNTALHAAGRRGHANLYAALLAAGANAEARNARGKAPKLLDKADADAACCVM
jgi:ankyrin repeat protein